MDDQGISDAFFTVLSIGIVVVAGILIAGIVLAFAGSQGKAVADRTEGLQEPSLKSGLNAFYYTIDPASSDLASADPNKIPPDRYICSRIEPAVSLDSSGLPKGAPRLNGMAIWTGYVVVPAEGDYVFSLDSVDGSWAWIDGRLVADNHGTHPETAVKSAPVHLSAGQHRIKARYYYTTGACCKIACSQGGTTRELRYCH